MNIDKELNIKKGKRKILIIAFIVNLLTLFILIYFCRIVYAIWTITSEEKFYLNVNEDNYIEFVEFLKSAKKNIKISNYEKKKECVSPVKIEYHHKYFKNKYTLYCNNGSIIHFEYYKKTIPVYIKKEGTFVHSN